MADERKLLRFVIGTAGHIDHGKSTLVRSLTGIDPDRLEEEKRRGMTIDIGFAHIRLPGGRVVGFIDVPGHEKFVRNMVAGATAVHAVLLVVAADDSVMPQTEEHLAILNFLDIKEGMVVITKADLVDEETLEIVRLDVEQTVKGTFLEGKPIVAVSATTGQGMDNFMVSLEELCDRLEERRETGIFRYYVQRVFSSQGYGTVLTGVTVSGSAGIGDTVELMPGNETGRIRNLQAYHSEVDRIYAGHCGAINLADLKKEELQRGMVAGTPEYLRAASEIEVKFTHAPLEGGKPLKDYSEVFFHAGSAEVAGKIALMGGIKHLEPGCESFAQLRLSQDVVVWPGMRFIIRRPSPPETLGGGVVLAASGRKFRRSAPDVLKFFEKRLAALGDPVSLATLAIEESGSRPQTLTYLCSETGLLPQELSPRLAELVRKREIYEIGKGRFVSSASFEAIKARIVQGLNELHKSQPLALFFEKSALRQFGGEDDAVFDLAVQHLLRAKMITEQNSRYQVTGFKPPLDATQSLLTKKILSWFDSTPFDAHSPNVAAEVCTTPLNEVERLYSVLRRSGEIIALPDGVFLSKTVVAEAEQKLRDYLASNPTIKSADFKAVVNASRKVAIALLDYFEKAGVTYRKGNEHALRKY